ncbi:Protein kinase PINOID [Dichanthelium oligosanthes]|uniref:non-specific serine/threonine protein kinase n=1 Tax=Dichanthelium oligosanthes TaxID=888268 RepID=A0A1E5VME2_9POAL|nr:Protein kinase PINOID [Dichanthelium oligosanthes]
MAAPASSPATAAAAPASSSPPPKPPNNAASTTTNTAMIEPQSSPYPDAAAPAASSVSSASSSSSTSSSQVDRSSTFSLDSSSAATPSSSPPRPHRASDVAWAPIRGRGALGPRDFTLLRRVGAGDIGTVYLCRLEGGQAEGPACAYAMKVVDRRALAKKGKLGRAAAEKRVLRRLDHPFLPTMFADFDAGTDFSCIVMEFCPGGDLHSLRHRMPGRRFPLASARFYAAEVLLALEYLHMMGIVYRDLKPENVLIRGDGHIMLTDFDLSLESTASPSLEEARKGGDKEGNDAPAPAPTCLPIPELQLLRLRRWKRRSAPAPRPRFVAEPVDARSSSFVGTHEYVAPEVARGGGHGAAVDWWAYGVFLYELIYGRTPFVGETNEATLRNIVRRPLEFPTASAAAASHHGDDAAARDLIARLLDKDPCTRLGSKRGAADVKAHGFFKGLNLALLRSSPPPVVPPAAPLHRCDKAADVQQLFDHF